MKVLLSIKPEYAEKILDGEKQFEYRKSIFKQKVKTVLIYATKPVGQVIGEFDIEDVLSEHPNILWSLTSEFAGISRLFFNEYFCGRKTAYAIKVKMPHRYEKPIELNRVLANGIAPQSFCYLP